MLPTMVRLIGIRAALVGAALLPAMLGETAPAQIRLAPGAHFARCYGHLTRKPVPLAHPLLAEVRAGRLPAAEACARVLDRAMLAGDGRLTRHENSVEALEARRVLGTFYDFHRGWFPNSRVEDIPEHNDDIGRGTEDVFDTTEPALAVTHAMFAPGARYEHVLRVNSGFRAIRDESARLRLKYGFERDGFVVSNPSRRIFGDPRSDISRAFSLNNIVFHLRGQDRFNRDFTTSVYLQAPMVAIGELVGIERETSRFRAPNFALAPGRDSTTSYAHQDPALDSSFYLFSSRGGGVLGLPVYLLLNMGLAKGQRSNGADKVPRRWAQQAMQTFLCASFPALRYEDAAPFVDANAQPMFRKGGTCVTCHATLDRAAYVARNFVSATSDFAHLNEVPDRSGKMLELVGTYRATEPSVAGWSGAPATGFHRQKPTGRLYYRSFGGALVDREVEGPAGLGVAMSEQDDYYSCAAKRYFEFFTGIQVPLYDRGDSRNAEIHRSIGPAQASERQFVESLGRELRKHQSLRALVKAIVASGYYQSLDYREVRP